MVILLGPSGHPAIPGPKDTKSIQNDFTQSIQKNKNTLSFPPKWFQNDFRPSASVSPTGAAKGTVSSHVQIVQMEVLQSKASKFFEQRPWWSMMIRFHLFPVSVSFLFPSVSRLKLSTRRRDDKGCFPRYFGLVLSALSCLSPSKKKHVRKQFIIRMSKGCKLWCIQLWSLSTLWWLRARISCQKMPNCISKTNTDILKYLEMMVGQLLSFRFCSRNPYTYIYIICIYKCINILSIQSLMVFSCLFMSFHVSTERSRSPFAFSIWTFVFFARWPETRSNECADFLRAFWLFSQAWLLSTP